MFNFLWHKISVTVSVSCLLTRAFCGSRKEIARGPSWLITAEEVAFSEGLSKTIICPSGHQVCPSRHLCGDLLRLPGVSVLKTVVLSDHILFLPKAVKPQKNYVDLNSKSL